MYRLFYLNFLLLLPDIFAIQAFKKFFTHLFSCTRPQLRHVGASIFPVACKTFSCGMWDLVS